MNRQPGEPPDGDAELARISTGSRGLDDVLGGGFDPERMYLYEGRPGSGKTTLALQFLLEGVRRDERALYTGRPKKSRRTDRGMRRMWLVHLVSRQPAR